METEHQKEKKTEYIDSRGQQKRAKQVKTVKNCQGRCRYKCAHYFIANDRKEIFDMFWSCNDTDKSTFYANTTDRSLKNRKRTASINSRKQFSISYYFLKETDRIRVCKQFYLSTIDIRAKRIEYFYQKKQTQRFEDRRGKHAKKTVPDEVLKGIRKHINSFDKIPSHYCRANTKKEYLKASLTLSKMFKLYQENV